MTELHYGIVGEEYFSNGNTRISYGIAAYVGNEPDDIATVIATVNDISSDKQKLAELVGNCNEMGLSILHLNDVIEDFLVE